MGAYAYQGKDMQGRLVRGQIEAANESEARVRLRAQKIVPIKVVPKGAGAGQKKGFDLNNLLGGPPKIKPKELQIFSRQFATMITSGIPIVQGLEILANQTPSRNFREVLMKIKGQLEAGKRLYECFQTHPQIFDKMYVSMVKAGEEGGVLDTILNRLALYLEKNGKLRGKVTGALWYPAGVLIVASIVIFALLHFVIPKFEKIFKSGGMALPSLTQMVVDVSHALEDNFLLITGGIAALITVFVYLIRTPEGRDVSDRVLIKIPVIGSLIQKSAIARFTRTMATMLGCGVGILDALDTCATVTGNIVVEAAIRRVRSAVADGKSIVTPMSQEKVFPAMVTQMVGVGEASGTMDSMFGKIADFYEEEVDYAVGAMTTLMEPLMMVFLGGIVAVLMIAMYLPVFNLAGAYK